MKSERHIILMIALMVLSMVWGLVKCQEARADWYADQSLLPGKYMIVEKDLYKSAQVVFQREIDGDTLKDETKVDIKEIVFGMKINVTKEYNVNGFLLYLNKEPITLEKNIPLLFHLVDSKWIQVPFPCKYREGEVM